MLHRDRFPVVVGVPSASGGMVFLGVARNHCAVAASRGTFGCAGLLAGYLHVQGTQELAVLLDIGVLELHLIAQ